jgi:hypothetical protein
MNFQILRIEKLKTFSDVAGATNHIHRLNETPNADSSKAHMNKHGGESNAVQKIKDIWESKKLKPRKDAVVALEYFVSASPDFFKDKGKKEILKWAKDTHEWISKRHGVGLVNYSLHMDETTPHMHFICTPIHDKGKEKGWGLSAKHFANGKAGLAKMQDSYQEHIVAAGHDLDRGLKGSKAKHQSVKKFYAEIEKQQELSEKLSAELTESIKDLVGGETPSIFKWKRMAELLKTLKQTVVDLTQRLSETVTLNVTLTAKNKQLEKQLKDTKDETYGFINDLRGAYPSSVTNQQMANNMREFANDDGQRIKNEQARALEASKRAAEAQKEKDMQLRQERQKASEIQIEKQLEANKQQRAKDQEVRLSESKKHMSTDALPEYQRSEEMTLELKPQPCKSCGNFPCKCCRGCNSSPCKCNK